MCVGNLGDSSKLAEFDSCLRTTGVRSYFPQAPAEIDNITVPAETAMQNFTHWPLSIQLHRVLVAAWVVYRAEARVLDSEFQAGML